MNLTTILVGLILVGVGFVACWLWLKRTRRHDIRSIEFPKYKPKTVGEIRKEAHEKVKNMSHSERVARGNDLLGKFRNRRDKERARRSNMD